MKLFRCFSSATLTPYRGFGWVDARRAALRRRHPFPRLNRAGWFNGLGQYLGTGDLSATDLIVVSSRLRPGEAFVVAEEIGAAAICHGGPRPDLLVEYGCYLLLTDAIYALDRHGAHDTGSIADDGLGDDLPHAQILWLSRWRGHELLRQANSLPTPAT